jgi:hypothetical protein
VADYATLSRFIEKLSVLHLNEFYYIMKMKDNFQQFRAMDRFLVKVSCKEPLRQLILNDWYSFLEDREAAKAREERRMNVMGLVAMMIFDEDDGDEEEDEEDDIEENDNRYMKPVAVKVFIPNEDPALAEKSIWMEGCTLFDIYFRLSNLLIGHKLSQVRIQRYVRPTGCEDNWICMDELMYNHLVYNPDYMILQDVPSERRLRSNIHNFMCLHTPTRTIIRIMVRNWVQFKEKEMVDSRLVNYKFTYTRDNGEVLKLMALTWLNHEPDAEEVQKYKYDILKGSAIWFCKHIQSTCDRHMFYDYM